jgi:4-hydroxysphinganine ceramide fatty acyl 2-hydroxylase
MKSNFVSAKDETVRMFDNNFLEALSRVHPAVPLIIFLPVIFFMAYTAVFSLGLNIVAFVLYFLCGLAIWTFTEYFLHRFVFHLELPGKLGARIHFIFHGVHHDYPNDSRRLVLPPSVSIPLAALFYFLFRQFISEPTVFPFYSGFLTGYLCYDMIHYAIHHFRIENRFWKKIKEHHMRHHYVDASRGFGVSSAFWDVVIGTDFEKKDSSVIHK